MLKGYRKRFIILNMALVGTVLIAVLAALGAALCRNHYSELKSTMTQVVEPFDKPDDKFTPIEEWGLHDKPSDAPDVPGDFERPSDSSWVPGESGNPPEKPSDKRSSPSERITTVFYDAKSGDVSILSSDESFGETDLKSAINEIISKSEDYGTLREYSLIYYKEMIGERYRIAVADISYINSRMAKTAMDLSLVFVVSMLLMFIISVRISKFAAKPMEDAISMEREFVADISHDLKTPITVILANNSIIRQSPESSVSEQSQWINSTDDAAKSMMNMINEMLTLSSLESIDKSAQKAPADLSSALEKSILQLESLAYDRNISVNEDVKEGITIMSVSDYAERICTCLIENALKYEPSGGAIEVLLSSTKKKATLTVANRGSVISKDDLPHIFDRFYRGDKSRSESGGHGLGLPIAKQMTDAVGAEMNVLSDEQNGTVFSVTFDICQS